MNPLRLGTPLPDWFLACPLSVLFLQLFSKCSLRNSILPLKSHLFNCFFRGMVSSSCSQVGQTGWFCTKPFAFPSWAHRLPRLPCMFVGSCDSSGRDTGVPPNFPRHPPRSFWPHLLAGCSSSGDGELKGPTGK